MHKENLMPVDSNHMPIEIRNLTKTFGAVRALDGLDLTVREGEVHGFLGPTGPESRRRSGYCWAW